MQSSLCADSKRKQLRLRGWLLIALLPLLAMAGALVWRVPAPTNINWFVEEGESELCWSAQQGDEYWCLHALTGKVTKKPRYALENESFSLPDGSRCLTSIKSFHGQRWQGNLAIRDPKTGQLLREIPFDLPELTRFVGDRYLVSMDADRISALDLCDATSAPFDLSAPLVQTQPSFERVPGKNWFWRINDRTQPGQIEVFEILERSIQRRYNWPVGTLRHRVERPDETVLLITPDNQHIERRSLESGESLGTTQLPRDFNSQTMECSFQHGLFVTFDRTSKLQTFYDSVTGEKLRLPHGHFHLAASSADGRLRLFVNHGDVRLTSTRFIVYDTGAAAVRFDMPLPQAFHFGRFLPGNRLLLAGDRYGVSSNVIDLSSGRVTHRQSPFRWVMWAIPLLVASFIGWAVLWLRVPVGTHVGVWCDLALLSLLALLPLILRLLAVGDRTDLSRLPFNYGHGVFLGLFQISVAWLFFGSARLTLRYIPGLLVLSGLVATLLLVLGTQGSAADLAVSALATTLALVLAMCLVAGAARPAGWRLVPLGQIRAEPPALRERISTRDLFIAITCFALAAAALRPLAPYLMRYKPESLPVGIVAMHVAGTFAALLVALTPMRMLFRFGIIALVLLSAVIVAQQSYHFVIGRQTGFVFSSTMVYFRVIATSALATYVFALAYRFRGWRFARSSASSLRAPRVLRGKNTER